MQPNNPSDPRLNIPTRDYTASGTSRPQTTTVPTTAAHQDAVADLTRSQINTIYMHDPNHVLEQEESAPSEPSTATQSTVDSELPTVVAQEPDSPYQRTHSDDNLQVDNAQWGEYHSAWQNYYQQYFHRYYAGHLMQTQAELELERTKVAERVSRDDEPQTLTPEDAMEEIRGGIRGKINQSVTKVRKSHHFVPILAASGVMIAFLLLQYGPLITSYAVAYASPGAINPSNVIIDPSSSTVVTSEPRIIIPKINVDVPTVYDNTMGSNNQETHDRQMDAMAKGAAWFAIPGANSRPGQNGNTVLSGHSSNALFDTGSYKFIFAKLEQLAVDDVIYVNYESTRYTYKVTRMQVVLPSDVSALYVGEDKPYLTLITCTPLGTSQKRLLVFAEQVSPSPSAAAQAPAESSTGNSASIPGSEPGFIQRLFGN